jgi:hypothetical protein
MSLVSKVARLEVRMARHTMHCNTSLGRRSQFCNGKIQALDTYVADTVRGEVAGRERWIRDKGHYCEHCAPCIFPKLIVALPEPELVGA